MRLSEARINKRVVVTEVNGSLSPRLLHIGLVPGTVVTPLIQSPLGDPTAYLIRGAVIALRQTDAEDVIVIKS